jgi:hypothetical protein
MVDLFVDGQVLLCVVVDLHRLGNCSIDREEANTRKVEQQSTHGIDAIRIQE